MGYEYLTLEETGFIKRWLLTDRDIGTCKYCDNKFSTGWYCPIKDAFWCFSCDKKWTTADKPACGCLVAFIEHIVYKVTCTGDKSDMSNDNDKKGSEEVDEENAGC